jgi:hypothetical protein
MRQSRNPVRVARRKTELHDKLGSERPRCMYCGCAEPVVLRPVTRRFLVDHHLLGRNHDPDSKLLLCQNCHALAHENLLNAGVDLGPESNPIRRVAEMVRAEAVHHEMMAAAKWRQVALLEGRKQ